MTAQEARLESIKNQDKYTPDEELRMILFDISARTSNGDFEVTTFLVFQYIETRDRLIELGYTVDKLKDGTLITW